MINLGPLDRMGIGHKRETEDQLDDLARGDLLFFFMFVMIWGPRTLRTQDSGPRTLLANGCLFSEVNWVDDKRETDTKLEHKERRPFKNEQERKGFICFPNLHLHEELHIVPPRSAKKKKKIS